MQKDTIDMGFERFEQLDILRQTLPYATMNGLCVSGDSILLCDFSGGGREYTGARLLAVSLALSKKIKNHSVFGKQKRIGIVIPPSYYAMVCNYACIFADIIPVNLNFTLGKVAMDSCLKTGNISQFLGLGFLKEKLSKANVSAAWTENFTDIIEMLSEIPESEIAEIERDVKDGAEAFAKKYGFEKYGDNTKEATLIFTSGSEGAPKGAILTQRNLIANSTQIKISAVFKEGDIMLANLPIFHSFGYLFEVWYMAIYSQPMVTLYNPLDVKENIRAIVEKKVTSMIGTPTFYRAYVKHATAEQMKTLRLVISGAEKTPAHFHELWNKTFNTDSYREGYGLTEASPIVGVNLDDIDYGWYSTGRREGSIGKLFPGMRARVVNPSTLEPLPIGEQGLLALQGANVFPGYLNNAEATNKALKGGWLVTGDISRLDDDGFVFIEGRQARFSKIGGEMVPHITVEDTLSKELGLDNSGEMKLAVSSRVDEGKGEALVLLSCVDITLSEAKEALRRAGISNLWHPKYLVKVDTIPLLASGKLDLKSLHDLAKFK